MKQVEPDTKVTMKFAMRTHLPDGTVKERPPEETTFIFGVDPQVPALEKALAGARPGERIEVHVPPKELYGAHDPELIREIPREGLIKQRLKEGTYYRQMKKGSLVAFKIVELRPRTVLADFNGPMAGISVDMDVEVKDVREATPSEVDAAYEATIKKSIGCG